LKPIYPGGTIGIIGGGQLARMIALEARRMGYRIAVLDPNPEGSAAQVSDIAFKGAFGNARAAHEMAAHCDVITIDSEHVPADLLEELEDKLPVRPSSRVLRTVQDRLVQRQFLDEIGVAQPLYASVSSEGELQAAAQQMEFPAVLKTRREGYDGKGQARVHSADALEQAWQVLGCLPATLEKFINYDREVSAILARAQDGDIRFYDVAENDHRRHILHTTRAPAPMSDALRESVQAIGAKVANELDHVGMLAVELFATGESELLVNEIAPRTHNSGHYTFGACATSQFEQHVRAICGLPLGDPTLLRPSVMLNLLGDTWKGGEPSFESVHAQPGARLHLYGKTDALPGRKMGHVLVLDDSLEKATAIAKELADEYDPPVRSDSSRSDSSRSDSSD